MRPAVLHEVWRDSPQGTKRLLLKVWMTNTPLHQAGLYEPIHNVPGLLDFDSVEVATHRNGC